jgi:hypothetical protein
MKLVFKSYKRRDNSLMIYINSDRGVSVGVSAEQGFGPSTKHTAGQKKLIDAAKQAFADSAVPFTGDLAAHKEGGFCAAVVCGPYTLVGTDVGNIGGHDTGADGGFIIRDGKILPCGQWIETA